jgi:hypothetical protein
MALTKNANAQASTPAFEAPDDDVVDQAAAEQAAIRAKAQERLAAAATQHAATKPAEEAKPSASREVATPTGTQVAKARPMINPLEPLKNAFPVEWDTLRNLVITNGNVMDKTTSKALGDTIGLELLSFQDQWVVSPGVDGDEAKEFVRYSDDGVTTTQGEDMKEYLAHLKASGYEEAKISERMVICGSVFDIGVKGAKDLKELQDALVQISLPPTSKATFKRYQMDQAFKIGKGFIEAKGAERVRIECDVVTKGQMSWTVANFSRYDAAGA